jgi:hypothetical protein
LRYAAEAGATAGVTMLIEPINTRDIPGFFLNRQDEAHAIVAEVGAPQPQGADGPLPLPDRRGRRRDEDAPVPADRHVGHVQIAACPSATSRTSARSTIRTCSTRSTRRLRRLGRLRVPAEGRHVGRASAGFARARSAALTVPAAIVTGGARGIGLAIAEALCGGSFDVAVVDVDAGVRREASSLRARRRRRRRACGARRADRRSPRPGALPRQQRRRQLARARRPARAQTPKSFETAALARQPARQRSS